MSLVLVGINHETAPLPTREQVVFNGEEVVDVLKDLKNNHQIAQAMVLSTCNRTEVYAMTSDPLLAARRVKEALFYPRLSRQNGQIESLLYQRSDADAVHHLFRVSCGLESMVLGEHEILGQVKQAYELSQHAESLGAVLHRLAHQAFRVGKRARAETRIGWGPVSIAYAAVELAEKVFQTLRDRPVLLVGAGENAELCAQHLLGRGVKPLLVINRTLERAEVLARDLGAETVSMDQLATAIIGVDIVVTTTGATGAIIDKEMVRSVMRKRDGRALVFVDIAVPRDVDPETDSIQNVFRFDMDVLQGVIQQSITHRQKEVSAVERLVEAEVEGFMSWWESLAAGPVIRDLHQIFEKVRLREIERNEKRFSPDDREKLEVFSRNLLRKFLAEPTKLLKSYNLKDPTEMERLSAIREVFRLDQVEGGEDDTAP